MSSDSSIFRNFPDNLTPGLDQIYYLFAFSLVGDPLFFFLRKLGLNCTQPKHYPGRKIVSTLIFFENVYLELFWLDDNYCFSQSELGKTFNYPARVHYLETGASPFGFGLSHATNISNFPPCNYQGRATNQSLIPEQLPQFLSSDPANLEEPICYRLPESLAIRNRLERVFRTTEKIGTPNLGMRQLTNVKLTISSDRILTPSLVNLVLQKFLEIESRKVPLLELIFDHRKPKKFLDLRPFLPIVLRY